MERDSASTLIKASLNGSRKRNHSSMEESEISSFGKHRDSLRNLNPANINKANLQLKPTQYSLKKTVFDLQPGQKIKPSAEFTPEEISEVAVVKSIYQKNKNSSKKQEKPQVIKTEESAAQSLAEENLPEIGSLTSGPTPFKSQASLFDNRITTTFIQSQQKGDSQIDKNSAIEEERSSQREPTSQRNITKPRFDKEE